MKTMNVPFMAVKHFFLEITAYLLNNVKMFLFNPKENIFSVYEYAYFKSL